MPRKEMATMDQRLQFIVDYLSGHYTKKALCMSYGISRPTGDKWIERFHLKGPARASASTREDLVGTPARPHRRSLRGSSRRSCCTRASDPRR